MKRHISKISGGERLRLNLNHEVTRAQFENDSEPENVVEVTCVVKPNGSKVFVTGDGAEHNPKEFQYDYKGCFFKNENDLNLWLY